jgi:lipopolysaccharide export system protein LptC
MSPPFSEKHSEKGPHRGLNEFFHRPRASLTRIGQRQSLLRFVKLVLALFAAATLVAIIWIANNQHQKSRFNLSFANVTTRDQKPVMVNPRFEGQDKDGNPFVITAHEATQPTADDAELVKVQGDFMVGGQQWATLLADRAKVYIPNQEITLLGNVQLHHEDGASFYTSKAFIDGKNGRITGDEPIQGQTLQGTIRAEGFAMDQARRVLSFRGAVRTVIYLEEP